MNFFFLKKKNLDHTLCYFRSTLGLFFIFLFKGKVCTRKMSVNKKLVNFECFRFFRGILGGGLMVRMGVYNCSEHR